MPDQDEFDPIGRDWRRAYDMCVDGESDFDKVGEALLRALTRMLQKSGGCSIFDELEEALEQLAILLVGDADERSHRQKFALFSAQLDLLARKPGVINRRLEVVAMRTARVIGMQLLNGSYMPGLPGAMRNYFGAQIAQNLMCHRALDPARAHAVGFAFTSQASATEYHDRLLNFLREHLERIGRQLAADPSGGHVRHMRLVPSQATTAMLWDDTWRLDEPDEASNKVDASVINDQDTETDLNDPIENEAEGDIDLFDGLVDVDEDEQDDIGLV